MEKPMARRACALSLLLSVLLGTSNGGKVKGVIKGSDSWVYVTRFCMYPSEDVEDYGKMHAVLTYPEDSYQQLLMYYLGEQAGGNIDDEFGSWQMVYGSELSCEERVIQARYKNNVSPLGEMTSLRRFMQDGRAYREVVVERKMHTNRARWFFISIAACLPNCGTCVGSGADSACLNLNDGGYNSNSAACSRSKDFSKEDGSCLSSNSTSAACANCQFIEGSFCSAGVEVEYDITFTNGDGFEMYLGADERGIVTAYIFFFILFSLLLIFATYVRAALISLRKYHHTARLLYTAVWCEFLGTLFYMIYWVNYANTGWHLEGLNGIGITFTGFAEIAMLLQIILVAKGWTIVRRKISAQGRMKIGSFITAYAIVYWAAVTYFYTCVDPAEIVYIFDTGPGYVLVTLRILAFIWIVYAINTTLRKYKSKKGFFKKYMMLGSLWCLTLPFMAFVNKAVDIWFRAKIMAGMSLAFNFILLLILVMMYNPRSSFNQSFPFHATTTAMLQQRSLKNPGGGGTGASFRDVHLRRAADISRRIRQGVTLLQAYAADLTSFLEELDPLEDKDQELPMLSRGGGGTSLRNTLPSDAVVASKGDQNNANSAVNSWGATHMEPISADTSVRQRKTDSAKGTLPGSLENSGVVEESEDANPFNNGSSLLAPT